MRHLIQEIRDQLRERRLANSRKPRASSCVQLCLETLESRLALTAPTIAASAVVNGSIFTGNSNNGLSGIDVTIMGTTVTGRAVNVTTTTDASGNYSFTQILPGTYNIARGDSNDFVGGTTMASNINIAQGQVDNNVNLGVAGLAPSRVSLADFLTIGGASRITMLPPGSGSTTVFSLNSAIPLMDQNVAVSSTTYLDLSANFFDPDTTDTTVTFNTSQGSFNVELFDTDAPQTVTNFLDYIEAGDYNNDLFQRLSNLDQTSPETPPPTPYQVLQAGGFTVESDMSDNVTGFNALTTFQPIANEFNSSLHNNVLGTLAMARGSAANSGTSQFFFNLTDNSQALNNSNGNGYTVFGQVTDSQGLTALQNLTNNYTPTDVTTATGNSSLFALPLTNGFTPASNFPTGATTSDLAVINSITVTQPSKGHLTYAIVGNSNPSVVTATLGSNTSTSTFSANQLQLVAGSTAGSSVITLQITDNRGETVTQSFTVTTS